MEFSVGPDEIADIRHDQDEDCSVSVYGEKKYLTVWIDPSKVKVFDKETGKQYILILLVDK